VEGEVQSWVSEGDGEGYGIDEEGVVDGFFLVVVDNDGDKGDDVRLCCIYR
jgi:hypothetical protein